MEGELEANVLPSDSTATEAATEGQQEPAGLSPEQVKAYLEKDSQFADEWLASLDEERAKKVPAIEKRVAQYVTKKSQELEKTYREKAEQERQQAAQRQQKLTWANQVVAQARQNPQAFVVDPEAARTLAEAHEAIRSAPNASGLIDARATAKNLQSWAKKEYSIDITDADSIEEAIDKVTEARAAKTAEDMLKTAKEDWNKELAALRAEFEGVKLSSSDQPEKRVGGQGGVASDDEFIKMFAAGKSNDFARAKKLLGT